MIATKVIHNSNTDVFFMVGAKVGSVRTALADAFNLPFDALAFVNGLPVDYGHRLRGGETLEFCLGWGRKGAWDERDELGRPADLLAETVVTFAEATRQLPKARNGKRTHVQTIMRWATRGLRSRAGERVVLESIKMGGLNCTSREALMRFFKRLNDVDYKFIPLSEKQRRDELDSQSRDALAWLRDKKFFKD